MLEIHNKQRPLSYYNTEQQQLLQVTKFMCDVCKFRTIRYLWVIYLEQVYIAR